MKSVSKKWMPAIAVPAVIAAVAVGANVSASAAPQLEAKTPQQLIEFIAGANVKAYSGQFSTTTRLGLPALPDAGAPASFGPPAKSPSGSTQSSDPTKSSSDAKSSGAQDSSTSSGATSSTDSTDAKLAKALNLLAGTHQARVFVNGTDQARLQVLGDMQEQDVILKGRSLWTYDSAAKSAVHTTLPQKPSAMHDGHGTSQFGSSKPGGAGSGSDATGQMATRTPAQLAKAFLATAGDSTKITVGDASTVAGREVYNLVLQPKSKQTLVDDVTIGVDAETGVPLAVSVDAVDQGPAAINVAFTTFTPQAPDAARFDFTPPAGTQVTQKKLPARAEKPGNWPKHTFERPGASKDGKSTHPGPGTEGKEHADAAKDAVDGKGWDAVATIPANEVPAELKNSGMLNALATPVTGGKLLHTSLVNVLITDSGSVVVGAVQLDRLQAVAQADAR